MSAPRTTRSAQKRRPVLFQVPGILLLVARTSLEGGGPGQVEPASRPPATPMGAPGSNRCSTRGRATIGRTAGRGVLWTYLSAAGSKLLVFVSTVILARLLIPAEFGQVGFALLVIGYMDTVGDLGVSSALIYEREDPTGAADATFLISVAMGLFWFCVAFLAAPLFADFFGEPRIVPILRVLGVVFIVNSLGNTHDALLRRNLAFKKRLVPDFAMAAFKGLCSVVLAGAGWGVWSLVYGQLIGTVAATVALWIVVPWRPGFRGSMQTARRMLGYSGKIMSVDVLSAIVSNADYVIVGRLLGTAALGLYTLAYRTPEMLITMVIWVIGRVTFPVYSRLRSDPAGLSRAFLATLRYLSLVTLPAGLGLALLGGLFVSTLYGTRWSEAALTLQVLALVCALRSLGSHAGDVYKATGQPNILIKLGLLRAAILIPAMIWGTQAGILGVAIAQLVITAASTALNLYVAARVLSLPVRALLREFRPSVLASLAMAMALHLLLPTLAAMPAAAGLATGVCAGALVYAAGICLFGRDALKQAWAVLGGER